MTSHKLRLLFLIFVVCNLPVSLLAARLELRQAGSGATDASILVGEEIEVELWVDSENQPLSGAAVFLSFDPDFFALVEDDRGIQAGFQPFAPGTFLANGETFRNYMLDEDDPAAGTAGIQLDYSIVRANDQGEGPIASFRLRALAPTAELRVRIDESGVRETRFFLPDGDQQSFRFITPLRLAVQGITIGGLPERLVLPRGGTSEFALDNYVFDPIYDPSDITWQLSPINSLQSDYDPEANFLTLQAPLDSSPWEQLIIRATNPAGQTVADTLEIFVNVAPSLNPISALAFAEDGVYELALDALVTDPDTPFDQLQWSFDTPPELSVSFDATTRTARLQAQANWNGQTQLSLTASDEFAFADTLQIDVSVESINDAPTLLLAPNLRLTRGRSDNSLLLSDLFADIEDAHEQLSLSWLGNEQVQISIENGRLVVSATSSWTGSEDITLVVEDSQGLTAIGPLSVTVVPSLAPALVGDPGSLSLASGDNYVLRLDDLVVDPDDADNMLIWQVEGQENLRVQLSSGRLARIEAPSGFIGTETLYFTVTDPTGESTSFALAVYSLPASGEPLFAPLPELSVPIDGVDSSIDLDDYIFDLDDAPSALEFFLPQFDNVLLRVDAQSHVLIIEPQAGARPSVLDIEIRAIDPAGNEVVQTLRLRLLDAEGESAPFFSFAAINDIALENGQIFTLSLDEFIGGDLDPEQITWSFEGQENLLIAIDPTSRQVVIRPSSGWYGDEEITLVAQADELPEQRRSLLISVAPPADNGTVELPQLEALPSLSLDAGAFDQSLDLDNFVSNASAADFSWSISGGANARVLVDDETYRLFVFAGEGWQGEEIFALIGTRDDGTRLETTLRVAVTLPQAALSLTAQTEVGFFAGTGEIRLPIAELIQGEIDPAQILWTAQGLQNINARYDSSSAELVLIPSSPWQSSDIIEIKAILPDGAEISGLVLAKVFPNDGSIGTKSEDFTLALVPNVFQPEYIDVFLLDNLQSTQTPLLRLRDGTWSDLTLEESTTGIWQTSHVLSPGQEGEVSFLALSINARRDLYKSSYTFNVGTVRRGSAKRVSTNDFSLYLPDGSFVNDAVIALLPTAVADSGPELVPLSAAYTLYSPQVYIDQGGSLSATIPNARNQYAGLYRYENGKWQWVESKYEGGALSTKLHRLGRYALLEDRTPPQLLEDDGLDNMDGGNADWLGADVEGTNQASAGLENSDWQGADQILRFADAGSGIGHVKILLAGVSLPPSAYDWDGEYLRLNSARLPAGAHELEVRVTDRAGNRKTVLRNVNGSSTPVAFALSQNFPNPFNPSTTIPFTVPALTSVRLEIFNSAGQRVRRLADGLFAPGIYELNWDARDDAGYPVSSGLYLYRLEIGGQVQARKMTLMR